MPKIDARKGSTRLAKNANKSKLSPDFLTGGGEMEKRIRSFDWKHTSLGLIETWPQSLKTAVNIVLQSPVPLVMLWGKDGIMIYNDAYAIFAGARHPFLLGSKVLEGWPEVADFNRNVMRKGFKGQTLSYQGHTLILYRNNIAEEVTLDLNYSPIMDESGKPAGVLAIVVETTQRVLAENKQKVAEDALRESEQRFRALVTTTADVVFRMNPDWSEMRELKGKKFLDNTGKPIYNWLQKYIHPQDQKKVLKTIREAIRTRRIFQLEHQVVTADGTLAWTLSRAVPILDQNGNIMEWFGAASDVTARKMAEKRLIESEAYYRKMTDNMPLMTWITNAQGECTYLNKQWFHYTGQKERDSLGFGWLKAIHPEDVKKAEEIFREANKKQIPFNFEYRLKSKKLNSYRWHLNAGMPRFDEEGKLEGYIGGVVDIHERKLLEEQKDEFIGIASHELKTPVTSLKAFTQVMQRKFEKSGDQPSALLLNKMDTQINKLTNLINDFLDVTKIEGGKLKFNKVYFTFDELVEEVIEEVQRTTETHHIQTKGDTKKKMYGDRHRISQVITNMLTNAIKYSPHADKVILTVTANATDVILSVQDFGIGIPKEKQEKVFERFYRVNDRIHTTVSGMGLGMYISAEIIKRQNGKIWVESSENKGSTFSFQLPFKK